jgi:hypothetical protein
VSAVVIHDTYGGWYREPSGFWTPDIEEAARYSPAQAKRVLASLRDVELAIVPAPSAQLELFAALPEGW